MIPAGSTIGILGGGQLGRMLAMAAAEMGYKTHIFCPEKDCPASQVADNITYAEYTDIAALKRFAQSVDIITYEFENIPSAPLKAIADKILPNLSILETCQHRLLEKQALNAMGVATAPFAPVASEKDFQAAVKKLGTPSVLKTCSMGYDGKGQWKIEDDFDAAKADVRWDDLILEGFIKFRMEISVIVARDAKGNVACYTPVQNIHKNHILSETIVPAPISAAVAEKAEAIAKKIAEGLKLVGLLAVEMFVTDKDEILVNELAPRPHNSGHWTIDACKTSQFEQTLHAICALPFGDTKRLSDARMLNLIGDEVNDAQKYTAQPNTKVHLYGKKETRPGRKMGHVTFLGDR